MGWTRGKREADGRRMGRRGNATQKKGRQANERMDEEGWKRRGLGFTGRWTNEGVGQGV